jgi:hypothetical protein
MDDLPPLRPDQVTLRSALRRIAGQLQLTEAQLDTIVRRSLLTKPERGASYAPGDSQGPSRPPRRRQGHRRGPTGVPVIVQPSPGHAFGCPRRITARAAPVRGVAYERSLVRGEPPGAGEIVTGRPPERIIQLMAYTWRALLRTLRGKCLP